MPMCSASMSQSTLTYPWELLLCWLEVSSAMPEHMPLMCSPSKCWVSLVKVRLTLSFTMHQISPLTTCTSCCSWLQVAIGYTLNRLLCMAATLGWIHNMLESGCPPPWLNHHGVFILYLYFSCHAKPQAISKWKSAPVLCSSLNL
jgi:hypothetical protein